MDNHTVHHFEKEEKRRKRGPWILLLGLLFILLIAGIVWLSVGATRFFSGISDVEANVEDLVVQVEEFDIDGAQSSLNEVEVGLRTAESGTRFFRWMHGLPWIGDHVEAVDILISSSLVAIDSVDHISRAAEKIGKAAEEIEMNEQTGEVETFFELSEEARERMLNAVHDSWSDLLQIDANLRIVERDLQKLDTLNLSDGFLNGLAPFREGFTEAIAVADVVVPIAATLDELAGIGEERQWLLLFQNDMELRPGGGFLGVYGLAKVKNAEVTDLQVADTFSIDVQVQNDEAYQVAPPDPLRTYVGVDKWYFRDANWSPDFAESAQVSAQLLRQQYAQSGQPVPEIHGVIGFTPTFASWLLEVTGPIVVNGEEFTVENLPEKLEFEVQEGYEQDGIPWLQRKAIVGELTEKMIAELKQIEIEQVPKLLAIIARGFTQKQVGIYSFNEGTQQSFKDAGWSGEVEFSEGKDVLMVVDANMNALKTDPAVKRMTNYSLEQVEGRYVATVTVQYDHQGEYDFYTTRYRNYTRIYVPQGATLVSTEGLTSDVTTMDELGLTSFGGFFAVEPGNKHTVVWKYQLPESFNEMVASGTYQLNVVKQMGAQNNPLTLHLDFDKKMKAAYPSEDPSNFGDRVYELETVLEEDAEFIIQF